MKPMYSLDELCALYSLSEVMVRQLQADRLLQPGNAFEARLVDSKQFQNIVMAAKHRLRRQEAEHVESERMRIEQAERAARQMTPREWAKATTLERTN